MPSIFLNEVDPKDTDGLSYAQAQGELKELREKLSGLQERFSAEASRGLLIVLQGMDGSGKDQVISELLSAMDPAHLRVYNFTSPSEEDKAHDFLWRFHPHTPAYGMVHVFDRSHYEEVIYPRVHKVLDDEQWKNRLESINDFERMLEREGTTIVKLMMQVSKKEQGKRLKERLEIKEEQHEFSAADIKERRFWKAYQQAYQQVLDATHTEYAPWHIIPADEKWFIPLAAGRVLVKLLKELDPKFPGLDRSELKEAGIKKGQIKKG